MSAARAGAIDAGSFRASAACALAAADKTIDATSKYARRHGRAAKFHLTVSVPTTIAAWLRRRRHAAAQADAAVRPDAAVHLDVAARRVAAVHLDAAAQPD